MTPLQLVDKSLITFGESVEEIGRRWVDTWHLTPARNLESIERHGLWLYPLRKPTFPEMGIWLWASPPEGMNAHWTVIQRMIDNETNDIALLRVRTRLSWTWLSINDVAYMGIGDDIGLVHHNGSISGQHNHFIYHLDFPARIGLQPIPWAYITVEKVYSLSSTEVAR